MIFEGNWNGYMRNNPVGTVMHSTNGNTDPSDVDKEFNATLNWFSTPNSGASAHATIHFGGMVCFHDPELLSSIRTGQANRPRRTWHDLENNDWYIGIELAKSKHSTVITDDQLRSAGWLINACAWLYGFPVAPDQIIEHRNTIPGRRSGKIDIAGDYTYARLRQFL